MADAPGALPRPSSSGALLDPVHGPRILLATAALLLFIMPGASNLWTHEGRWAVICREMMRSGDYLHPYLLGEEYYDKPLLSYWLMIGVARLLGGLSETALRLPSMLAGLLAVWCTWRIGRRRFGPEGGLVAGWLLATSVHFIYWGRLACSDMLNLAAIVGAAAWFTERRDRPGLVSHGVFAAILALGAQMKGLVAPVLSLIAVAPDLFSGGRWRRHLGWSLVPAAVVGAGLYLVPFLASGSSSGGPYGSSGLAVAFRENVLRFFQPFDHKEEPHWLYLEYLLLYSLPWTVFLPGVVWRAVRGWKGLGPDSRWPLLASLLILVFLSLSGSRRNYYLLPILPFVMLAIADWIREPGHEVRLRILGWTAGVTAAGLFLYFGLVTPLFEGRGNLRVMASEVRAAAELQAPWSQWRVLLFDTRPHMGYYLDPGERPRRLLTREELTQALKEHPRTVVVTYSGRKAAEIEPLVGPCRIIREKSTLPWQLGQTKNTSQAQTAFIPEPARK
jgi:4-amino-4-deoxy-L-arabinose transferase-like glycosyltransferase